MAKRFIDTDFFKDSFVRGLEGAWKGLYIYLFLDCSNAGIWNVETDVALLRSGLDINLSPDEILAKFEGKIIPIGNGQKWFIKNYLKIQHNGVLKGNNKAHIGAIKELLEHDLIIENEEGSFILKEGASKGLPSPQGNGKGISNGKGNGKESSIVDFEKMGFLGKARYLWQTKFPDYVWQDTDNANTTKLEYLIKNFIKQRKRTNGNPEFAANKDEVMKVFEKIISNPPTFYADKMDTSIIVKKINDFISESYGTKKPDKNLSPLDKFKKENPYCFDGKTAINQGYGFRMLGGVQVPILKNESKAKAQ
jgi:hypothetical protein